MQTRFLALVSAVLAGIGGAGDAHGSRESMFAQFVGVCQGSPDSKQPVWKFITFTRSDLSWAALQPKGPDDWNRAYLEKWGRRILRNRERGVETLPMLGYMAPWAARRRAWSFVVGNVRYEVAAAKGTEPRKAVAIRLDTGKEKELTFSPGNLPPENVKDWERFVERVVAFLSKPPYNVTFFQPWNEAHDQFTGFWYGGLDEYMRTIHLPAARIIRKHGCKVVYGGFPCCGTMQRLVHICDKYHAWDTLDILDIHYFPVSAWEYLFPRVIAAGKAEGLWQTEIGFTKSTGWAPNAYPRFFHWALAHEWRRNRYRIFQFAYWSPDDPKAYGYRRCLLSGNRPSCHGKALMTLGRLLDSAVIRPYAEWRTAPVLRTEINENLSSVEGFDTGRTIVLAVHLMKNNRAAIFTDWNLSLDNMHLDWPYTRLRVWLPRVAPAAVDAAARVGIYGSRLPLRVQPDGKGVRFDVPVRDGDPVERKDNRAAPANTFYIEVRLKGAPAAEK